MSTRIPPASPPWTPEVSEDLAKLMPPGVPPIGLFRTLAKNPRILRRLRKGGLLDPGRITLRQRELVILRTTALAGAEHEWGVHAAFFGPAAGLGPDALHALVHASPDAPVWTPDEALLLRTCDELHATAHVSDALFAELRARFEEDQILELLALCGFYRAVSYLVNGAAIEPEPAAPRFPPRTSPRSLRSSSR